MLAPWRLTPLLSLPGVARADDDPLTIADLAAYRAALGGKATGEPLAVGFRALWDHPEAYRGRRVRVEGRVARRFRQGTVGTFPPLEEAWAVDAGDNPLCLVFPVTDGQPSPRPGDRVLFVGTFLKRVRYQGGDGPRLAPLIVGDRPPSVARVSQLRTPAAGRGLSALDWLVGGVVAALVVLVLARQHLRRPPQRPLDVEIAEPPPVFLPPPPDNGRPA